MGKLSELYRLGSLETRKDEHDPRNFQFASIPTDIPPANFMEAVIFLDSIRAHQKSQDYGSCTSYGGKRPKDWSEKAIMSAKFLYYFIKQISGRYDEEGDYPINAQKALVKYGVCEEKYHPSVAAKTWQQYAKEEPSAEALANALTHKSRTYWEVDRDTLGEYMRAMGTFQTPVNISMEVYTSYFNCPRDGHLPLPKGSFEGGHSLAGEGYETATIDIFTGRVWIGNSWGENWGLKGRCWIPFEEFDAHSFTSCFVNLDINKPMIYKIIEKTGEQFLIDDNLMMALNIADNIELNRLASKGLKEKPLAMTQEDLAKYTIYPLIEKSRLGDLLGYVSDK